VTRLFAVVVLAVVPLSLAQNGCSGRAPAPTNPDRSGPGSNATPTDHGPGSGSGTPAPADTGVSEADCHAAIDHMIAIDMKERPADQQLAADQVAELRTQMRASYVAPCREQDRSIITCIIAATTSAAIKQCDR
jgi:hypothetical protein